MPNTYPLPPYNMLESRVINNTVGAADAVLSKQTLTIYAANPLNIYMNDVLPNGFIHTAYAAGTAEITTVDFAAATVVAGVAQTLTLTRLDNYQAQTIEVVPSTTSTTALRTLFVTAINNLGLATYTAAAGGGSTLTITEVGNIGGFITASGDSGVTVTVSTAHVNSSGTYSEVLQYDPNTLAGGQFDKYQIVGRPAAPGSWAMGMSGLRNGQWVIWVEKNDAQFAAFNTALTGHFTAAAVTDAVVEPYVQKTT